jgi:tetratricopeptide (TPR) repeat protein
MRSTASTGTRRVALAFALCALVGTTGANAARLSDARAVRDPHYGEVLYQFFQQNYFAALTDLMVSEHFERVSHHRDDAELLRGGMFLSYGMHLEAARIFEQLTEQVAEPVIRDRAWFYMGKILYQRGHTAEALSALGRIGGPLPEDLEAERHVLEANLLMSQSRYPEAIDVLKRVSKKSEWALFGRYNLGVALVKAGERDQGVALLEEAGGAAVATEELKALRDKTNVALGYAALQENQHVWARGHLERVRLNGLQSNKALLGMGWAYSLGSEYERALVAWMELRERTLQDTAVLESLLAIPYALGKVGAYKQSLQEYEHAILLYDREIAHLDESIGSIRSGRLTDALLALNPGEEMGWFWQLRALPESAESRYLLTLLASHDFHEALKNFRDIQFLRANLARWAENISAFDTVLATRRQAHRERLPRVLADSRALSVEEFSVARDRYAAEIDRIATQGDAEALADDRAKALIERLERVKAGMRGLAADEASPLAEKYRRLRGVLLWDLTTEFKPRLWQAQQSLAALDEELAQYGKRRAALETAQRELPRILDGFQSRIADLRSRIVLLRANLAGVSAEQERYLAELAVAELEGLKDRIATYLTQARFAVAQIYDEAASKEEASPRGGAAP